MCRFTNTVFLISGTPNRCGNRLQSVAWIIHRITKFLQNEHIFQFMLRQDYLLCFDKIISYASIRCSLMLRYVKKPVFSF